MPALTSYTPYETLVFFQNVAQHGVDTSSLQEISTTLNQNQLIRESSDYDAAKFSPDALHHLYNRTINTSNDDDLRAVNGDSSSSAVSSLKRKLSTSPSPSLKQDHEKSIQQFVDKLYAQFRNETIKELRQQEQDYQDLQRQIAQLEDTSVLEQTNQNQSVLENENKQQSQTLPVQVDRADPASAQLQATLEAANGSKDDQPIQVDGQSDQTANLQQHDKAQPSPVPAQRASTPRSGSASGTPLPRPAQPPGLPQSTQHPSPSSFNRALPPPSPQRNNYGLPPPQAQIYPHNQQGQPQPPMLPPIHALQRMPSHEGYSPRPRPSSQGRGSPMPQHPPPQYPPYAQYQQAAPHSWPSPAPQQYVQQYQPSQHYLQQQPLRYPQVHTPNQQPYQSYPNTAPVPYAGQQQWRGPSVPQYHQYAVSANTTPVSRPHSRTSMYRSSSSTPWKSKATPISFRPRSPSRLDREVSPLSEDDSSSSNSPRKTEALAVERDPEPSNNTRQREKSATPTGNLSRSQSVRSNTSEAPDPPRRRVGRPSKVKAEPPSTPAPMTSDSEQQQRSSGRRGRPRASTSITAPENQRTINTAKRKRDAPSSSPVPRARSSSNVQPPSSARNTSQYSDPNFVVVSRNFSKTSQLLLNEISSHKLAGIFAKPLSERDAPGYKSLVNRPQDLKSIKAAITKGSKAALAAIDELESKSADDDVEVSKNETTSASVVNTTVTSTSGYSNFKGEGPIGNGFYLVQATEDLVPPKAIVNSSQLETELVRMFANATMFNPMPSSERGFGRTLRLRKRGGELRAYGASNTRENNVDIEDDSTGSKVMRGESEATISSTSESDSSSLGSGSDEDGIIADAREMFEDVERLVARWRELEGDRRGGGSGLQLHLQQITSAAGSLSERHNSISASSVAGDDGIDPEGTPNASVATSTRKRRRIGDH